MSVRILGLDWFDVVVHAAITIVLGVAADAMFHGPLADVTIAAVLAGSLAILGWRRKQVQVVEPLADSDRLVELEARVTELDQLAQQVYELEERLDFAERMLAQTRDKDQPRLPAG